MFDTRANPAATHSPRAVALSEVMLISADHPLRSSWTRNLRKLRVAMSVTEATSLHDARALLHMGGSPDLILLDADLAVTPGDPLDPDTARIGCAAALGALRRRRLVMIGVVPEPGTLRTLLESGARGYLFGSRDEFGDGPDAVGSRRLTATVIDTRGVSRDLSLREVEVLQHAADGRSNSEIGRALHLSPLTVKSHLGRIARRLGTGDRAHLVLLALRSGAVR